MGKTIGQQDQVFSMADPDFFVIEVAGIMKKVTKIDAGISPFAVLNNQANTYSGAGDQDFASSALRNFDFIESSLTNVPSSGAVRLGLNQGISWFNSGDVPQFKYDAFGFFDFIGDVTVFFEPAIRFFQAGNSPPSSHGIGDIFWTSVNSAGGDKDFITMIGVSTNNSVGIEEGSLRFSVIDAGLLVPYLSLNQAGEHQVNIFKDMDMNDNALESFSFIESNDAAVTVGAIRLGTDEGMAWSAFGDVHKFEFSFAGFFTFSSNGGVSFEPAIRLLQSGISPPTTHTIGDIFWSTRNSNNNLVDFITMIGTAENNLIGSEEASFSLAVKESGPLVGYLSLNLMGNHLVDIFKDLDINDNDILLGTGQITVDSGALGDLYKHDATGFSRFPIGAADTVLKVNAGGTDLEYGQAEIDIGSQPPGDAQSTDTLAIFDGVNVLQDTLAHVEDITLHTGVRFGMALSINADPTKFDVASGEAIIMNRNPNPEESVVTRISFAGQTAIEDTNLSEPISHIFMNSAGTIIVKIGPPQTIAEVFDEVYLGTLLHFGGVIGNAISDKIVAHGSSSTELLDLVFGGGTKLQGSIFTTPFADLTLKLSAGILRQLGRGFDSNKNAPNEVETPASSPVAVGDFFLIHVGASGDVITDASSNVLDPTQINTDGLGTLNPLGGSLNVSIIRVFQAGITNDLLFYYGTKGYANMSTALAAVETTWIESEDTRTISPIALIFIDKGVTDLSTAGTDLVIKSITSRSELQS